MTKRWSSAEMDSLSALLDKFSLAEINAKAKKLPRRQAGRSEYRNEYAATIWLAVELTRRADKHTMLGLPTAARKVEASIGRAWEKPITYKTIRRLHRDHEAYLSTGAESLEESVQHVVGFLEMLEGKDPALRITAGEAVPADPRQFSGFTEAKKMKPKKSG